MSCGQKGRKGEGGREGGKGERQGERYTHFWTDVRKLVYDLKLRQEYSTTSIAASPTESGTKMGHV